ncbi:MAG TPA: caspase family protein [Blastocatellia bacterium]|nr:caspase family protein [Blastocatellia bacterium]
MKRSSLFAIAFTALLCATSSMLLPSGAYAQDDRNRSIRQRKSDIRVGVTKTEINTAVADDVKLWAVLIGVSSFKYGDQDVDGNFISNLRYADNDARELYKFLSSPEGGGFRDVREGGNMTLLIDEDATKENVERALSGLKQTRPNDFFVVFIAAHGLLVPENDPVTKASIETPYFVLHDTDPRDFKNTGIPMEYFRDLVKKIPARKGLVLSDTCNSAGVQLTGRSSGSNSRVNERYITEINSVDTGVGFIWSAGPFETAKEPLYLGHGAFTYCLLEGLRGNADVNQDAKVTFQEISEYVRDEVPKITEDKQHPHFKTDVVEANYLALSVVDYADLNPETGASQYGTLIIRTPGLDGVAVSIDGSYYDKLNAGLQRTVKIRAGARQLTFERDGVKREIQAVVEPRKSKIVEVNLSFTQGDEEALVESTSKQLNVYLSEPKEPSKESKDIFYKGVESFNKQRFSEAAELFTKAIQRNGGAYHEALVYLGRAQQSLGRENDAVASFKTALSLRPTDYETQTLLAEARFGAGDNIEDVIKELEGIIYRHPGYDYARVVLADVLISRKEFSKAERQLKRAIDLVPTSPPAHMIMAEALTFQNSKAKQVQAAREAELALELFDKVSRKQVSASRGLKRLSISHIIFGGGRYVNYEAMAEARYIHGYALINLVRIDDTLAERDSYLARARENIDEAIKLAGKTSNSERLAQAMDASAQIFLLQANPVSAVKVAEQGLKLTSHPDLKGELHYTLFSAYKADQKYGKAAEHLKEYLALSGSQLDVKERTSLGEELELLNRKKDANRQK